MIQRTPGPWEVWGGNRIVTSGRPSMNIAEIAGRSGEVNQANARFIVRACNAHDDLLAACKAFVELFRNSDMRPEDECHELFATVHAAIAKADPQPQET